MELAVFIKALGTKPSKKPSKTIVFCNENLQTTLRSFAKDFFANDLKVVCKFAKDLKVVCKIVMEFIKTVTFP